MRFETQTTIWATGSISDIQREIVHKETHGYSVRQLALFPAIPQPGQEPVFDGFIVYEY